MMSSLRRDDRPGSQLGREFDEDQCREFLSVCGEKVVRSYLFSMGMEEIYACIWDRYGPDGTGDAISLLHEILEDEDIVGAGLGLDSDIWRPWKNNFKLRDVCLFPDTLRSRC
jgi:hypothetical protein